MCENMKCLKKYLLSFLLMYFIMVLNIYMVNGIKIKCSHIDEFFAAYPETQCQTYYKCTSKGRFEVKDCNRGDKFDMTSQECLHSSVDCVEPTCANRGNGVYQDITHGCRRYYTCFAGRVTTIDHCPAQQLHNGFKCVPEKQVVCPEVNLVTKSETNFCSGKLNGVHVDPTSLDCTSYIMCQNGRLQWRKHCSNQAVFNGQQCVPSPLFQCPKTAQSSKLSQGGQRDSCANQSDGMHANAEHGCTAFFRCLAGRMVELNSCKSGQYFDPDSKKCIYERVGHQKRCQQIGLHDDCANKVKGYYSDRNSCGSYYFCQAGHKMSYLCIPGRSFNGQKCVSQSEYKCEKAPDNEFCLSRSDGYYKDEKDGCRAYKYCANGNKITYLCEEQQIFDVASQRCVPTTGISIPSSCSKDAFCSGKSDGYHADLRSNCHNYIYCQNQQRIVYFKCANNYVFNGQQCVPPKQYACPSLYNFQNINCIPKQCLQECARDGLFPDLSTNCMDYYFCIGGKPTKSSCPSGKRFNGELCVPADQFMCPTICNGKFDNNGEQCPLKGYFSS